MLVAMVKGDGGGKALDMAVAAGRLAGLDVAEARVVREQSSIHVELPRAGVMARIEETERADAAERQVRVAGLWTSLGAPVVPLVRPELQPCRFADGVVTLWRRLHACSPVDLGELGRTTRALHETTRRVATVDLPLHDPFADTSYWIDWPVDWLPSQDRTELKRLFAELERRWLSEVVDDPLGRLIVHGDLHGDNALHTAQGLVLVDLEDAGVGSASWDLVPLAVGVARYGDSGAELQRFVDGYGADPRQWPGFRLMCRIYELFVTTWAIRCSERSSAMKAEAALRVEGILGRSTTPWTMT